jgi:hypothetical protein
MARIVNGRLQASTTPELTPQDRRKGERKLAEAFQANPLRVVRLPCHGPIRDAGARVGDWIWCEKCSDLARVESVSE